MIIMIKSRATKLFQLNAIFSTYVVMSGHGGWVEYLMTGGRFKIGEYLRWTSFAKTFDEVG
ncbi:MAG: hypothetical protein NTV68_01305 [Methanomicrobiales archaeon]|nr:hypothetical protein [Methanomicrobiales archaeon]